MGERGKGPTESPCSEAKNVLVTADWILGGSRPLLYGSRESAGGQAKSSRFLDGVRDGGIDAGKSLQKGEISAM